MFKSGLTRPILVLATGFALVAGLLTTSATAEEPPAEPAATAAHFKGPLKTVGNKITANGTPITLRGVSVLAPEQNDLCQYCDSKPISELIGMTVSDGWNSDVVRLPVTEVTYGDLEGYARKYIDPYVQQAVDLGIYIIVDLHHVANYGTGGVSQSSVKQFWDFAAPRYGAVPNVIFEVFNEPIAPDSWSSWKAYIQPVVDSIRTKAPNTLILMGNPQWSTRVNGAVTDPIAGGNIAYVYHLYPNQGQAVASVLDPKFGTAAQSIPIVLTEFGWNPPGEFSDPVVTQGTTSGWGIPLRAYLDARPHISWTGWIFDNFWKPQMFDYNWNLLGGEYQGAFLKAWLAGQPYSSPCMNHLGVGATVTVSSSYAGGDYPGAKAVDGDCSDAGRWLSAVGDTQPTLTVTLPAAKTVKSVDVYSGYSGGGAGTVLVDFRVQVRTNGAWVNLPDVNDNTKGLVSLTTNVSTPVDQVRLVVFDPSNNETDVARVIELALH